MPKLVPPKSWKAIRALGDGTHFVGHVPGLAVQKRGDAASWLLIHRHAGRPREMGLGGLREVPLDEACEAAREARKRVRAGIDPIEEKRQRRQDQIADAGRRIKFGEASKQYIAAHAPGWRNPKHRQQWSNTLRDYATALSDMHVDRIDTPHIIKCLEPIWATKTETATRVRQRIESVLDYCTARGFRKGDNPARWKGHLDNLLAAPNKLAKVEHFAALPWRDMPEFMAKLRAAEGMGARALEFAILTAARSGEVRGAMWEEIDLDAARWTIPAERMKAGREHVVPLSAPAVKLLREMPRFRGVAYVFPSPKRTPLSDMTLTAALRRMKVNATAHGFRSAFRDWCAESTNYPREVAEMALAHTIGSAVEAAYRRGDLMAKRTRLMRDWAAFLATKPAASNVTPIRQRGRRGV
jgi:integrase